MLLPQQHNSQSTCHANQKDNKLIKSSSWALLPESNEPKNIVEGESNEPIYMYYLKLAEYYKLYWRY